MLLGLAVNMIYPPEAKIQIPPRESDVESSNALAPLNKEGRAIKRYCSRSLGESHGASQIIS